MRVRLQGRRRRGRFQGSRLDSVRDDIREKGLSPQEVYD